MVWNGVWFCHEIWCVVGWGGVGGFFFFQAEDGIRDIGVTGVQTCALPIYIVWQKLCTPEGILSFHWLNFCPLREARVPNIGVASTCLHLFLWFPHSLNGSRVVVSACCLMFQDLFNSPIYVNGQYLHFFLETMPFVYQSFWKMS